MTGYAFAVGSCLALVAFLLVLLRTRKLREKYAVMWFVLALGVSVLSLFPGVVGPLARWAGVQTPVNLLFAASLLVLLLVCIQLSAEITALEEETRTLAEEVALLRLDVERGAIGPQASAAQSSAAPSSGAPSSAPGPTAPDPAAQLDEAPQQQEP
ncbi:DUF2304 domain-containing protein [Cellulomonas phragmiteti]|uniref:DUF2304 domain-containing protein n=1 Tax=Cellulomonas phragmiteti TaxID=478780 RepID=A0ABQ4DKW0_9CELL|nr:DUF2304 domain-containing protein [Cellulomonas phragmiteti]GIG39637.1 hypothetical protein Cph01nite_13990 [Cellulomonas phragmiteti]